MESFNGVRVLVLLMLLLNFEYVFTERSWVTTDELENHISPADLREFQYMSDPNTTTTAAPQDGSDYADPFEETTTKHPSDYNVDCFGLGSIARQVQQWFLDMKPAHPSKVNTHFYLTSRNQPKRVQVYPGKQFGLEWTDFKPERKTVVIIHGFMSHSNASWVNDMANAFLDWADVNVVAVDWSGGGNTWKYWRAVANTRTVGRDVKNFFDQVIKATGAKTKDFHFVGHSLGAHICSYASYLLGGVSRITGLDPAQPCFITSDGTEKLDTSDADFVDIIHTNGRLLKKIGFGLPEPIGHADFYPNGGMKQPGCYGGKKSWLWSKVPFPFSTTKLQQAICSHGRAYLLFTESLINNNCTFTGHRWNLTYEGVNTSIKAACDKHASCSEMGIGAVGGSGMPRATGAYFVLTTEKDPYCPAETDRTNLWQHLLKDLSEGFRLERMYNETSTKAPDYADPLATTQAPVLETTTKKKWWNIW